MKQPINIIRGTTQSIKISIASNSGGNYVLSDDDVLKFGVKKHPNSSHYLIYRELTSSHCDETGSYILTIDPKDTKDLNFGCYYYDVGLQVGAAYYNVIECSEFRIGYNITFPEVAYE